jgi:hypothetical protein
MSSRVAKAALFVAHSEEAELRIFRHSSSFTGSAKSSSKVSNRFAATSSRHRERKRVMHFSVVVWLLFTRFSSHFIFFSSVAGSRRAIPEKNFLSRA